MKERKALFLFLFALFFFSALENDLQFFYIIQKVKSIQIQSSAMKWFSYEVIQK